MPALTSRDSAVQCLVRLQGCDLLLSDDWQARLAELRQLADRAPEVFWAELNSKALWGGAASLANQALNTNSGYDPVHWQFQVREFREAMIALGEVLQARGQYYPDVDAWLLAFNNWNRANV